MTLSTANDADDTDNDDNDDTGDAHDDTYGWLQRRWGEVIIIVMMIRYQWLTMTMIGKNTNFLNLRFSADFSKRPEDFPRIFDFFNDAFPKTFRHFPKFSIHIPNATFRKMPKENFL